MRDEEMACVEEGPVLQWKKRTEGEYIMDIMGKVEDLVEKITSSKELKAQFEKNPVAVLEKLVGVDLPDDQVNQLVDAIKAKITVDKVGDLLGGLFGKK